MIARTIIAAKSRAWSLMAFFMWLLAPLADEGQLGLEDRLVGDLDLVEPAGACQLALQPRRRDLARLVLGLGGRRLDLEGLRRRALARAQVGLLLRLARDVGAQRRALRGLRRVDAG